MSRAGLALLAAAIVVILALVGFQTWRSQVTKADAVATVRTIERIAAVVITENRTPFADLEVGAEPGKAPPKLKGLVADADFQGRDGITLWLIRAPPGTFGSYMDRSAYGLVAKAPDERALAALRALRNALAVPDGDVPWLDVRSFALPLQPATPQASAR